MNADSQMSRTGRLHRWMQWAAVFVVAIAGLTTESRGDGSLHPQDGPHVDLRIELLEHDLILHVGMNLVFMDQLVSAPREQLGEMTEAELDAAKEILNDYFRAEHPVTIDGIVTLPVMENFRSNEPDRSLLPLFPRSGMLGLRKIMFDLRYPLKQEPRSISFEWHCYPPNVLGDPDNPPPLVIQAEMFAEGVKRILTFTDDERGYTWHPSGLSAEERMLSVPEVPTPKLVTIPVLMISSVAGGLLLIVMMGLLPRGTARVTGRLVVLVLAIAGAGLGTTMGQIEMEDPRDDSGSLPSESEAEQIFAPLHANIYRAFDYVKESDIYDALAQSVDGALLDTLYDQMYESLIMHDEGGAVSHVDDVRPVELSINSIGVVPVEGAASSLGFHALYRWQVDGSVYHWGHSHQRTNEYAAEYIVTATPDGWRISDCRIIEQLRLPPAGEEETFELPDGDFEI